MSRDDPVGLRRRAGTTGRRGSRWSARRPARATARPNIPTPTGRSIERTQFAAAPAADAGVVGEAQVAGRRVDEVDHRAVGIEQPGGLLDGGRRAARGCRRCRRRGRPAPRRAGARRLGAASCRRSRPDPADARRPRDACAAPWWAWSRAEDTTASAKRGIAVRRWRLRHPAEAADCPRDEARRGRASAPIRGRLPTVRRGPARPTMRPDAGHPPGTTTVTERSHHRCSPPAPRSAPSDVVVRAAIVGLALATGYIHSTLGGLLFTLNAAGYARRRRRDGHPARPRRPLPLGRPPRPDRLRRDRHRRLGRSRARTSRPPTSPRPSRSR